MSHIAPKQVFADVTHRNDALTKDEIEAELRDRGLPLDLLPMLLNCPEDTQLDDDEIEYLKTKAMKDVTPDKTDGGGTEGNGTDGGA